MPNLSGSLASILEYHDVAYPKKASPTARAALNTASVAKSSVGRRRVTDSVKIIEATKLNAPEAAANSLVPATHGAINL
ncbi:MAG: hypothetical protein QXW94_06100 [Desulfurococcaceae archaeon]